MVTVMCFSPILTVNLTVPHKIEPERIDQYRMGAECIDLNSRLAGQPRIALESHPADAKRPSSIYTRQKLNPTS